VHVFQHSQEILLLLLLLPQKLLLLLTITTTYSSAIGTMGNKNPPLLATLFAPLHIQSMLYRSSENVAHQVFVLCLLFFYRLLVPSSWLHMQLYALMVSACFHHSIQRLHSRALHQLFIGRTAKAHYSLSIQPSFLQLLQARRHLPKANHEWTSVKQDPHRLDALPFTQQTVSQL